MRVGVRGCEPSVVPAASPGLRPWGAQPSRTVCRVVVAPKWRTVRMFHHSTSLCCAAWPMRVLQGLRSTQQNRLAPSNCV